MRNLHYQKEAENAIDYIPLKPGFKAKRNYNDTTGNCLYSNGCWFSSRDSYINLCYQKTEAAKEQIPLASECMHCGQKPGS